MKERWFKNAREGELQEIRNIYQELTSKGLQRNPCKIFLKYNMKVTNYNTILNNAYYNIIIKYILVVRDRSWNHLSNIRFLHMQTNDTGKTNELGCGVSIKTKKKSFYM